MVLDWKPVLNCTLAPEGSVEWILNRLTFDGTQLVFNCTMPKIGKHETVTLNFDTHALRFEGPVEIHIRCAKKAPLNLVQ